MDILGIGWGEMMMNVKKDSQATTQQEAYSLMGNMKKFKEQ